MYRHHIKKEEDLQGFQKYHEDQASLAQKSAAEFGKQSLTKQQNMQGSRQKASIPIHTNLVANTFVTDGFIWFTIGFIYASFSYLGLLTLICSIQSVPSFPYIM